MKFVLVDADGNPAYTATPTVPSTYTDGQSYGGLVARVAPDEDDYSIITTRYYKGGWKTRAPRPNEIVVWNNVTEQWVDPRTLAQLQADAWTRIKARREVAFAARAVSVYGIAYSITKDKGNLGDRIKSLEAAIQIGMATSTTTAIWRDLDDAEHQLAIAGYYALAAEMGARGQAIYERSWALDAQVKAATSNGALDSIDYDGGWP